MYFMEFYGFTRKNNSSVVITIPSKLNIKENTQVRVIIFPIVSEAIPLMKEEEPSQ